METLSISYTVQKNGKRKIEDFIPEYLDGDKNETAFDFVAHMRENKMSFGWAGFTNAWKANCKGRCICYINIGVDEWLVTPYLEHIKEYEDQIINEGLQNFVLDNVIYCAHAYKYKRSEGSPQIKHVGLNYPCNIWGCAPGKDITVCSKELTNICRNGNRQHFWFHDPDEATLDAIKKLLEFEKAARSVKNNEFI